MFTTFGGDNSSASDFFTVTPDNVVNFDNTAQKLYIGTAGDIAVVSLTDEVAVFKNIPAASILNVQAKRVNATGTTATDIVGLI